jgi:CRISPR-associated exonuclease Cas4
VNYLPYLAIFLFLAGLVGLWIASRQRRESGVPAGRIIYVDSKGWGKVEKPLYDADLALTGKPDYLVEKGDELIPVEVKSCRAHQAAYDSHIFQLATYCLLVQRFYDRRPSFGILHYSNRDFAIDYTPELEKQIVNLVDEIHTREHQRQVNRSHQSKARCQGCGYRQICDQVL